MSTESTTIIHDHTTAQCLSNVKKNQHPITKPKRQIHTYICLSAVCTCQRLVDMYKDGTARP